MLDVLYENLKGTSWLEIIAVITGLLSVWFAKKENIWVYPVGIISVLIYVYLCFFAGLYADMGINAFYFVMSVYGWYKWTRKNQTTHQVRAISWSTPWEHGMGLTGVVVFTVILYFLLSEYTDSTVPVLDAFSTSVFMVGMWLMALKKMENWIYWIVGDIICVFLFPYKGLVFSGFQYLVFLIIAIAAFFEWKRRWKALQPAG